ncbi:hypothetical protein A7982_13694 [Minicystis rosea]|nr:hypothetical protein A7982_13694 [Minicystis rosea]
MAAAMGNLVVDVAEFSSSAGGKPASAGSDTGTVSGMTPMNPAVLVPAPEMGADADGICST